MGHSAQVWNDRASVEVAEDLNGIKHVLLQSPRGASARVSLYGGQVVSWTNDRGEELLFTSSKAALNKLPKTKRGGISICFPQDSLGKSFVDLLLRPAEEDIKCWPNCFEFRLRVSLALDGNLILT